MGFEFIATMLILIVAVSVGKIEVLHCKEEQADCSDDYANGGVLVVSCAAFVNGGTSMLWI